MNYAYFMYTSGVQSNCCFVECKFVSVSSRIHDLTVVHGRCDYELTGFFATFSTN